MRWSQLGESDSYGLPAALAIAVRDGAEVAVLLTGAAPIEARFESINAKAVVLQAHPVHLEALEEGAPITVSFLAGSRVTIFMTQVHSIRQAGAFWIEIPRTVFAEMRRHPRIRVGQLSELRARARVNEQQWRPWLGDLSHGGARMCFEEEAPIWDKGTLVRLELLMHNEAATVVGMVVRQEPDAVGLRFRPMAAESTQARALARLIQRVEEERRSLATNA